MARPIKQGIDYFPLEVNFLKDLKVRKIMRACGPDSPTILICLLSNIYCDYGYFVAWDNDMSFLIADEVGVSEGAVNEVIKKALQVDFFNNELYTNYSILTSRGIQKRFLKAIERRKQIEMIAEYCVTDINGVNVNINFINVDNNSINTNGNQQSKVNKNKENDNKDINVGTDVPTPPRQATTFEHDSIEYKSSKYLADKILERNPNAKVPKDDKGLFKWCTHIDFILRIDKRPPDELRKVLVFAVKDQFWSSNILSTEKLRKQYDQLYMQMVQRKDGDNGTDKNNIDESTANSRANRFAGVERKDGGTGERIQ